MIRNMNGMTRLNAFKYFMQGYNRPARKVAYEPVLDSQQIAVSVIRCPYWLGLAEKFYRFWFTAIREL